MMIHVILGGVLHLFQPAPFKSINNSSYLLELLHFENESSPETSYPQLTDTSHSQDMSVHLFFPQFTLCFITEAL